MDYTRKRDRAKWSSLESVSSFGWSGSALLGGAVIDRGGYRAVFLATASLQAVSALVSATLLGAIHAEAGAEPSADAGAPAPPKPAAEGPRALVVNGGDGAAALSEPLLIQAGGQGDGAPPSSPA